MILLHVLIAITSIIFTGILAISPTQTKLIISYLLVTLTIISGTILILTQPVHILQTCIMGLMYIAVVFIGIIFARHKLAVKEKLSTTS